MHIKPLTKKFTNHNKGKACEIRMKYFMWSFCIESASRTKNISINIELGKKIEAKNLTNRNYREYLSFHLNNTSMLDHT